MKTEETLNITKNYLTFSEFYNDNELLIYKTLIEGYRKVSIDHNIKTKIRINAIIDGVNFGNDFIIEKQNNEIIERLNNIYLPYFESIEDYETCEDIKKIYEKIKGV